MAKMSISQAFSQRLRIEAASKRLRIIAEVVLGNFIGDTEIVSDSLSLTELFSLALSKIFSDSIGTTDQAIAAIGKFVTDDVAITESTEFAVSKPLTDAYYAADVASIGPNKIQSDSISMTDSQVWSFGKGPQDDIALSEYKTFTIGKTLTDNPVTVEVIGKDVSKTLSDSISITDDVSWLLLTLEEAFDSGSVTDSNVLGIGKQPTDAAFAADAQKFDITKALNDTVYVTDDIGAEATVDDDQTIQVQKRLINFAAMTDSVVVTTEFQRAFSDSGSISDAAVIQVSYSRHQTETISASDQVSLLASFSRNPSDIAASQDSQSASFGKIKSDIMGITDSGVLLNQDYVDNNLYFADDYVGEKRTF